MEELVKCNLSAIICVVQVGELLTWKDVSVDFLIRELAKESA